MIFRTRHGFASLPAVTAVALMLTLSLMMLFKVGLVNRDQAAKAELRTDYSQREEALLRALVAVFPRKAIACMKADHAASEDYTWDRIFTESMAMANAAESLPDDVVTDLGLESMRRGDVADIDAGKVGTWITSLTDVPGRVTPGTESYADIFESAGLTAKVPPFLATTSTLEDADAIRPVVTTTKHYYAQDAGLLADVTKYGVYNLIPYPNIRFGYATPGQPFVAKRNWWAFKIKFGDSAGAHQGDAVPVVEKRYVLSLYEIPSQLPIEGAAFAEIGKHQDGVAWNAAAITIAGGVYADRLSVSGGFGAERMAGKESIELEQRMTLDGIEVGDDFDEAGVREQMQVDRRSDTLPIALSANSGRLTFMPIHRGDAFLNKATSPNTWDTYSLGSEQCGVTVEATSMVSLEDQTPTAIRVRFATPGGGAGEVTLQRGTNWPTQLETGGDVIPFQTELTGGNRACLTIYPAVLNAWLLSVGGASVETNHSIFIRPDPSGDPLIVKSLASPPDDVDMSVIIRKGKDLTSFTAGLSIVAPLRVYVGDDLNEVPAAVPNGSGLATTAEYYPPLSIFSAELRIGTTTFNRPFEHHGQIMTLRSGGTDVWQPLDVKSGSDDTVHTDTIAADLKPLQSPAELPPVHQMNWLIVIEEIPRE
jgi:hypothetical protein